MSTERLVSTAKRTGRPAPLPTPSLALVSSAAQPARADTPACRTDLPAVVAEAIALFRKPFRAAAGLSIDSRVPKRFPLLSVNPQRVGQVLRILLGLAAASLPSGGAFAEDGLEVVVDSALPDATGPWVQVLIRRAGTAKAAQKTLDHPRSGLTAARSFAASFGGRIYCRERRKDVPEFVVMIPRK